VPAKDDINQMIDDCEARDTKMSEWEQNFISDISKVLSDGKALTIRQEAKLEMIWERVTQ
jgi:hypothetical protein